MTTRACYFSLIVLLAAPPAWSTDLSAGFDRTQVPPEALGQVTTIAPDEVTWETTLEDIKPIVLTDEWAVSVPLPIEGYASGLMVWWRYLVEQGQLDQQSFPAWAAEYNIDQAGLIGLLNSFSIKSPMEQIYWLICAAIWEKVGDDIETYLGFPPEARLIMAIHLAVIGREEDTKALVSSVSPAELATLPANSIYVVADELHWQGKSPRTVIWALKQGAKMRGGGEQALVCFQIMVACRQLDDPQVVREELIPWAEEALGQRGSEAHWNRALPALLWAYDYVGEPQKAAERGGYWLQQAEQRNVPPEKLAGAKRRLAQALIKTNQVDQAAEIFTPQFEQVRPEELGAWQEVGEEATRTVLVTGNLTFQVTAATCELDSVKAVVGERKLDERERVSRYVVEITFGPQDKVGTYETTLVIETNDPENGVIAVPIRVRVLPK